ncbi:prolyl oligopeptidase family serine peptidase [Temperatibacter marinus]|uniref:Prolyl oligopeptidase family serine peptidase n=1 Tax=Temperatibacter marinus TaxID=1456591 RepID=A0AA52EFT5_9PROT|nr:prolyl oligopeptidase family serine peptidase [Temperatibacter marinus]WND01529.1 prolyl oligopeptidase family serine peptidase [Temperatibacter marinus]
MKKIKTLIGTAMLAASLTACDNKPKETNMEDPYLWLEEVEGKESLAWVEDRNTETYARLKEDSRFNGFMERSLEVYNAKDKIAYGSIRGDKVYNVWRDSKNTRGLWRMIDLEEYNAGKDTWETILDFDKLAADEKENWVYKGRDCYSETGRCLIRLSRGGTDAIVVREFDMKTKSFVEGGFSSPESKQYLAWYDQDTLMIATDFGPETMNDSGYPRQVRLWKRGTELSTAEMIFEAPKTDTFSFPTASRRHDGTYVGVLHGPSFFTREFNVMVEGKLTKLAISEHAELTGYMGDTMILSMRKDWIVGSKTAKAGTLVSVKVSDAAADTVENSLATVYAPAEGASIDGTSIGKDRILVNVLDNVKGKIIALHMKEAEWISSDINLPANGTVSILSNDDSTDEGFLGYDSFLQPDTVYHINAAGETKAIKSLPARFDARDLVTEQKFTTSKDGTKVPYFVVRHKDTKMDGKTPTLQYGYGGFEISIKPGYLGGLNMQWIENGGAYVVANIRGGGEYGPSWHQSVLKENRQGAFDDFIAVSEALINSGLTSPKHLAVRGGSNGGLLMGAMITQRPDLYNGVICAVPLLDMLRYHKLLAGASWMGEYGNPDIPEERAYIEKYSPYQNLDSAKDYPEVFFYTSTKDDRVHPGHARKMAAKMFGMDKPVLYYENTEGGHAAASNLKQRAFSDALQLVYLMQKLQD